jgi:hypothetical protein
VTLCRPPVRWTRVFSSLIAKPSDCTIRRARPIIVFTPVAIFSPAGTLKVMSSA